MPPHHHAPGRTRSLILTGAGQRLAGAVLVSGALWCALWLVVG